MKTAPVTAPILLFFLLFAFFCVQPPLAISQDWVYTVQQGDNLWRIGKENLKSMRYWRKLVDLNRIEDPFYLQPGSTIHIPFDWLKKEVSVARLIAVSGEAFVTRNNSDAQIKAFVNMFLWCHDRIQTASESNVTLKFADGSEVLVQAESEVIIGKLMRYGTTGMAETNLLLESGRTHNKVIPASGPGSRFEIKTPSAIAAVRGTEYRIGTDRDGSSRVEVLTGVVQFDSSGKRDRLESGYGLVSFLDKKPLPPVKLLPPPDISKLPKNIVRVPFPIKIQPIPGAKNYRLQIGVDKNFSSLLFDKTFSGTHLWGPSLSNGIYFLRINGIDKNGLEGLYAVHQFSMAAHPVPPVPISPAIDAVVENCQPTFLWSQPTGIEHYHFQLADNNEFTVLLADEINLNRPQYLLQKQLLPGLYHWRLASADLSAKEGPYSDPQQFRCPPSRPDMSNAKLDKEEMVYRWRGLRTEARYRFQVSRDKAFTNPCIDQELAEPQFDLQGLTPGTYYIQVATITPDGFTGPYSLPQRVTVEPPPPHPLVVAGSVLLMIAIILL
ncbi:MAG: hypothetical protein CSA21_01495 [Deltaproteobacteria bacterium]|nr:MAG: hypothetical protein CSA21_01495 [Deltaproteobacteria bacterium]